MKNGLKRTQEPEQTEKRHKMSKIIYSPEKDKTEEKR